MNFKSGNYDNPYAALGTGVAADATVSDRVGFIRRTYLHLVAAVMALVLIETTIFTLFGDQLGGIFGQLTTMHFLIVFGVFIGASMLAQYWANHSTSVGMQYAGLGLFVVVEAAVLMPLLYLANTRAPGSIGVAALITGLVFGGLTFTVFVTKADFSFLRAALAIGSMAAFAVIIASFFFQNASFMSIVFPALMIVLMAGFILYETSNVLHHYRTDQHVGASLALFSSLATLFWYILRLVMAFSQD